MATTELHGPALDQALATAQGIWYVYKEPESEQPYRGEDTEFIVAAYQAVKALESQGPTEGE